MHFSLLGGIVAVDASASDLVCLFVCLFVNVCVCLSICPSVSHVQCLSVCRHA